jgi:hypothetical protein
MKPMARNFFELALSSASSSLAHGSVEGLDDWLEQVLEHRVFAGFDFDGCSQPQGFIQLQRRRPRSSSREGQPKQKAQLGHTGPQADREYGQRRH